jgi:pyruvate-ferredoxin/flavodoxin oxidoreductase
MTALAEAFNRGERETCRALSAAATAFSKEFGPDCVLAVFNELRAQSLNRALPSASMMT